MRSFATVLVLCLAASSALGDPQQDRGRRRRVLRVRGRPRGNNNSNLPPQSSAPAPAAPTPSVPSTQSPCPEKEGLQVYADPHSCHNFYKCANGTLTFESCHDGLLFDPDRAFAGAVENHCHYNWAVQCGEREQEEDDTRARGGDCPYDFGIFPYQSCYPSYIRCAYGRAQETPCEVGLVYDHRIHTCNYPDLQIDLGCNPSELLGGFVCPALEDLSPLEQRFYPFPRFAVPESRSLYIICIDDQPRLRTCGPAASFDAATLGCVQDEDEDYFL